MQLYPFVPIKEGISKFTKVTHKKTKQNEKKKIKSYTFTWRNQTLFWFSHHMIKSHSALVLHAFFPWIWLHNPHLTTHKIDPSSFYFIFLFKIFLYTSQLFIGGFQTFPIPIHFSPTPFTSTPLSTCPTGHPFPIPSPPLTHQANCRKYFPFAQGFILL